MCRTNETEDEHHFLFRCKGYEEVRRKCIVFQTPVARWQNVHETLTLDKEEQIKSLAKYIAEANQVRKKYM